MAVTLYAACASAIDWRLHVEPRGGRYILADSSGRERLLRGVNLATLGGGGSEVPTDPVLYEGACPANDNSWYQPPVCEDDIADLRARGFESVRFLVHWSQVEPSPGQYDETYLRRIEQVMGWAASNG
eukprot:1765574-Prymnesium_polylepis.1